MPDQLIVQKADNGEPEKPDQPGPKTLESAPAAARGETTRTAVNKLGESLKQGFGRLEKHLGNPAKQEGQAAAPSFFSTGRSELATPKNLAFPAVTAPASAPASQVTSVTSTTNLAQSSGKLVVPNKPADLSFPTPKALEARPAARGRASSFAPVTSHAFAKPSAMRSEVTPVTSPSRRSESPVAAFAGQPKQEATPRSMESQARSVADFRGPTATVSSAPTALSPMSWPSTGLGSASTATPTIAMHSDPKSSNVSQAPVRSLESTGQRVGFRTSSPTVAAPATPLAFTPRGIEANTAFARFEKMRPIGKTETAARTAPGAAPSAIGESARQASAAGRPENRETVQKDPGKLDSMDEPMAPGVSPKPGQLSSTRTQSAAASPSPFSSLPNLQGARMEQKVADAGNEDKNIKKAPWGNDKAQRDMLDILTKIHEELKKRDA